MHDLYYGIASPNINLIRLVQIKITAVNNQNPTTSNYIMNDDLEKEDYIYYTNIWIF